MTFIVLNWWEIRKSELKERNDNKAQSNKVCIQAASKNSYEIDPTLKDLAADLSNKTIELRNDSNSFENKQSLSFDKLLPDQKNLSLYAKETSNLPELKSDFKSSLGKIANTFSKAFDNLKQIEEANGQVQELLIENFFHTARALALAVEIRDPYTGGHSDRVFQISSELGKRCNISRTEQLHLEGGALLHDVGKIGIRDGVLLKPGPLTDSEYKEMQLHTIIGAQLVKRLNCLYGCLDAILFHHERMDGYGYPYGIKGSEIPLIARITSVADAFDAMTTNRIYRKALSYDRALEEVLRNSGTQFDPEIVRVFVQWWEDTFQNNPQKSKELYGINNAINHDEAFSVNPD